MNPPPRIVTLVLVTPDGAVRGRLAPFRIDSPWWHEAEPVVRGARTAFGLGVTILRILASERPAPHGGAVTYLAEAADSDLHGVPLEPLDAALTGDALTEDPLRLPWARPGGPALDLAWADAVLDRCSVPRSGPGVQVRSWNLSSLWMLPLAGRTQAWLKCVPPFFAHEGALLRVLQGGPVPSLLGHEGHRLLLEDVTGSDLHEPPESLARTMVSILVDLQRAWIGRAGELLAIGLPDFRRDALSVAIADVVERTRDEVSRRDRARLDRFVAGLDQRFAALAACGVPDTLVHGDFHPGNFRGDGAPLLLDWGDSGVGHPLLDQPAFLERVPAAGIERIEAHWSAAWRDAVPGSDPGRAATLLAPIGAARQAVIYRRFLDRIEATERRYHQSDPARWLGRVVELLETDPAARIG